MSVGTLTAISVDRLLALLLGLRYRQVVTLKRTYVIVFTLWLFFAGFSATYFWNPFITIWYGFICILLCLIISIFSYTKVFHTFRHHQNQVQRPCSTTEPNKSTEHGAIQKGSVQCKMVATDAGRLLSSLCHRRHSACLYIFLFFLELYSYFSLFKLFIKSDSLLLEDR